MKGNGEQPVTEKLYDFIQLEELAGEEGFLISLAQIFIDTMPVTGTEMAKACKAQDWMQVSKLAHKLKSTIDSMNIKSISQDIRTIEIDAKNKANTSALPGLVEKVNTVIYKVAGQLKDEFNL